MQPVFGFLLFGAVTLIASIVASKRGRSGILVFVLCVVAGFILVVVTNNAGGGAVGAAFSAFIAPIAALIWATSTQSSEQLAIRVGEHGDFKKCPFCAESIRREAVKCKHCGSSLDSTS